MFLVLIPAVMFAQDPQFADIPEEDEDLAQETEYTFNPIQAKKELKVGDFYWKKGSFRAAALRYDVATKWDPGLAEAYWKLAAANEKLVNKEIVETKKGLQREAASAALSKYLELEPDGKNAKTARKKLKKYQSQ
jgi:outer membrane protein assembly factor BamD (BamD/ComL family)